MKSRIPFLPPRTASPSPLRPLAAVTAGLFLLFSSACVSVTPEESPGLSRAQTPVLESLAVNGPVYRDHRLAGYDTSTQSTFATVNGTSGYQSYSGTGSSVTTNTVERTETFDNQSLQNRFVRHLEESNVAVRLTPEGRYRLDATVRLDGGTSGGKITWNVLNTCTGLFLIGSPYLGTSIVTVEVRAYDDDRYVRSYSAEAKASWRVPGLWGIAHTVGNAKSEAMIVAGDVALEKVVAQIQAQPPLDAEYAVRP